MWLYFSDKFSVNMRNKIFQKTGYLFLVLVLNVLCLLLNIYYTSKQKCPTISSSSLSLAVPMRTQDVVKEESSNAEPAKKDLTLMEKRALFMEVLGDSISRDFIRYKCKNFKRFGGYPNYISRVPHELYR